MGDLMDNRNYCISKVFNNNVVLVNQSGKEKIFIGRGIGFGARIGQNLPSSSNIEKVFSIEQEDHYNKFNQLLSIVDKRIIGICEEIINMVSYELNETLDEKIHIALTDHIAFTLHRLQTSTEIKNPFLMEIQTIYKQEYEIARKAKQMLMSYLDTNIPDDEIGFIALHIHSCRCSNKLSNTIKFAMLCNSIVEMIEKEHHISIDKTSIDYARLLTHIRFAIQRIINNAPIRNELLAFTKKKYKASYKLAQKAARLIEDEFNLTVVEDEIGFITLHIERCIQSVNQVS